MKKIILFYIATFFCFFLSNAQTHSRTNGGYLNLEKYWFYRYRLVNDFMKIGAACGESLPAQARNKQGDSATLSFADATIDLGDYIAALATEHKLLTNNSLSTARTDFELGFALNAFERIDKNAEAYCFDIEGTYPCNPQNAWANKLNGFFIRDDVPYTTFQNDNFKHLNRKYVNIPMYHSQSVWPYNYPECSIEKSLPQKPSWPYSVRCMPTEESQDQIINVAMGFALANKCLGGFGNPLALQAGENLKRMIGFIDDYSGSKWKIMNPVTTDCVFGIRPSAPSCANGGALFYTSSYGAAVSSQKWGVYNSGLESRANKYYLIWYGQQFNTAHWDLNFWGTFAAMSRSWYWKNVLIYPVAIGVKNSTWVRMKQFATAKEEGNPHLPYLYRVLNGRGDPFMVEETKIKLDWAPPCGIHNYTGNYSNRLTEGGELSETGIVKKNGDYAWHWSKNNLIHEYYSRELYGGSLPTTTTKDYNGLDYMVLFNLFSLQDLSYLPFMFNSYYKENFSRNFPDRIGTPNETGSYHRQLKLNFLEYLSAINKINENAYVTYRCAKMIELKPGFEAKATSNFMAYIDDYHIDCGESPGEGGAGRPSEEYHYAEINQKPGWVYFPMVAPPQGQGTDTTFYLDFPPDGEPYTPDSSAFSTNDSTDIESLTCEEEKAEFDSLMIKIYESGDAELIEYWDSMKPYMVLAFCDSSAGGPSTPGGPVISMRKTNGGVDEQSTNFNIYPNPGTGRFTFAFSDLGNYDIKVYNALGIVIYQTRVYNRRSEVVYIDNMPDGVYTAEVVNSSGAPNKQIRKLIISH